MKAGDVLAAVYKYSPVGVQNAFVSCYGFILRNQRFGGNCEQYLEKLKETSRYSWADMERYQNLELAKIVRHAIETVPFYREWARKTNLSATDVGSTSEIKRLPIVTKQMVRDDPKRFCSESMVSRKGVFMLGTSGTTGAPLKVYCDKESRRRHYAFFSRLRSWFGVKQGDRRATFFGRVLVPYGQSGPPYWRYDLAHNNLLFSSYHMSEVNLAHYYEKLSSFRPAEVIGYPSSLFSLAAYILDNKMPAIPAKLVITTAETLLAHQREVIERGFDAPLIDQYGCTEMTHFVSQCERGTYHVHPEHGLVEVVDDDNEDVEPGTPGRALCTGFINYTMPLLRYDIGDVVTRGGDRCECGRVFPVIGGVEGRVDDIIVTPDGRRIGRMDPVFKGLDAIRETQIVQTARNEIEVRVVALPEFSSEHQRVLRKEITERVGSGMAVKIEVVTEIPKQRNGKFKAVVSRIGNGE